MPRCGGAVKIVSFIEPTQPDVIDAIRPVSRSRLHWPLIRVDDYFTVIA